MVNQKTKTQTKNAKRALKRQSGKTQSAIPIAQRVNITAKSPMKSNTYKGTDFLQSVTLASQVTVANCVMAEITISPSDFAGTRLSTLSRVYDKYRFTRCAIRYVPSVPTTVGGQFVMYFDLDVSDTVADVTSVDIAVRNAMAHEGAQLVNVYNRGMTMLPIRPGLKDFFTGPAVGDDKLYKQAKFWMIASAGLNGTGLPANGVVGSLFLDYEIEFEGEQLQDKADLAELGVIDNLLTKVGNAPLKVGTFSVANGTATTVLFAGQLFPGMTTARPDGVIVATNSGPATTSTFTPFSAQDAVCKGNWIGIINNGLMLLLTTKTSAGSFMAKYEPWLTGTSTGGYTWSETDAPVGVSSALSTALQPPPVSTQLSARIANLEARLASSSFMHSLCCVAGNQEDSDTQPLTYSGLHTSLGD